MKKPEWLQFEEAVAAFVRALDPNGRVLHNVKERDPHHGGLRQRDVWIEAKIAGHFPVSVLVSCKRLKRKLHSGDVEAFHGELASSSAHVGVLYSYSGFAPTAITKGRALGIPCCRLYADQPPEMPEALIIRSYCVTPQIVVRLTAWPLEGWAISTWGELFTLPLGGPDGQATVLEALTSAYYESEAQAAKALATPGGTLAPFGATLEVIAQGVEASPLRIVIQGQWRLYQGRTEAHRISGSYEFTKGDFKGSVSTPFVDRRSTHPGPGWDLVDPSTPRLSNSVTIIMYRGNVSAALSESMGEEVLAGGA